MLRSASQLPIGRSMLPRAWLASIPLIPSSLARPANSQSVFAPKRLLGPSNIKRFASSGPTKRESKATRSTSVTTCTVSQFCSKHGEDLKRWIQTGKAFMIAYRTSYGHHELWESYKESLSRHARLGWSFKLIFIEDEDVLDGLSFHHVRNIHNDLVSKSTGLSPNEIAEYGIPGLDFFTHISDEYLIDIKSGRVRMRPFTLVSALWKPWYLHPLKRFIARYLSPKSDPEEGRGYLKFNECDLSPTLYQKLACTKRNSNEKLGYLGRYGRWTYFSVWGRKE